MKNTIMLTGLMCWFSLGVFAQHRPFVVEGKKWVVELSEKTSLSVYHYYLGKKYCTTPMTYFIKGDTIINEKSYKKVYQQCTMESGRDTTEYYSAIREDADGTVYQKRSDFVDIYGDKHEYSAEKVLYVFSPNPFMVAKDNAETSSDGLIYYDSYIPTSNVYLRYSFKSRADLKKEESQSGSIPVFLYIFTGSVGLGDHVYYKAIDGIGIIDQLHPFDLGIGSSTLSEVWENDELIYSKDWQMEEIKPEGIRSIKHEELKMNNEMFDLQGRRVTNPQKGSIYIQKGKKYINK